MDDGKAYLNPEGRRMAMDGARDLCSFSRVGARRLLRRDPLRLYMAHDYFDKVLSRKGAAPAANGRDTLTQLQGRVARKLDTQDSENRLAGLPS